MACINQNMVAFEFSLADKVLIIQLERNGRVIGMTFNDFGRQYNVRYFDNGQARTVYFFADELSKLP